ncbi:ExbD/TolR family protein [Limnobacter sp.]|uniref:ExbD/TolR family protein n=1 Tax=Limnobacter sp. TaxID=2003368 RepID=UPI002FE3EC59
MRIKRTSAPEAPDINLIPLIDVLLVIVIFLVVSTTFMQPSQLEVDLPGTQSAKEDDTSPEALRIRIGRDGNYALGSQAILNETQLRRELSKVISAGNAREEKRAIVEADAAATHQSVVVVMDMLASLGVARVSIATAGGKAK